MQVAILLHSFDPCRPLMARFFQINAALKHGQIHRKVVPPKVSYEKVNCCYMGNRQDSFNTMNPQQDVKHPTRYVAAEKNGIVQNQPGSSEKGYAPEDGQVIKLFPISPSIEPWRFLNAQNPADMPELTGLMPVLTG